MPYLDEAKKIAKIERMGGSLLACWIQHEQDVGRIVPTDVSQCTLVYSSAPQCITMYQEMYHNEIISLTL